MKKETFVGLKQNNGLIDNPCSPSHVSCVWILITTDSNSNKLIPFSNTPEFLDPDDDDDDDCSWGTICCCCCSVQLLSMLKPTIIGCSCCSILIPTSVVWTTVSSLGLLTWWRGSSEWLLFLVVTEHLQSGQVVFEWSQRRMQSIWKKCLQEGSKWSSSFTLNSPRQTQHLK